MSNVELVLVLERIELANQGVGTDGIYPFELASLNHVLPQFHERSLLDNKTDVMVEFGLKYPQLISYYVLNDQEGKIFAYRRKGKEEGLLGKWSIGIGGHIDHTDMQHAGDTVAVIAMNSFKRELKEEVNLDKITPLTKARLIATLADTTSKVHVGYTQMLSVNPDELVYEPAEFNEVKWLSPNELKFFAKTNEFETWSQLLLDEIKGRGCDANTLWVDEAPYVR